MSRARSRGPGKASGFTLVEILVAMALMSVVMLALGAAMRTIAQTEERVDRRLQTADEMRVATNFLSATLERISPRKNAAVTQVGSSLYLFAGAPNAAMWVGVMPARYGAGGRYFFRIALENQGPNRALVIRFAPWSASAVFPDWAMAESRVLVPNATRFGLEYADEDGSSVSWLQQWPHAQRLPSRIRISLQTAAGDWPFLTIAMRQLPAGDTGRGAFSLGPE
ncbi:MAG: prepilin-type N-terminal cleavage/methylation domain-containing protein [Ramlibacter sp.]